MKELSSQQVKISEVHFSERHMMSRIRRVSKWSCLVLVILIALMTLVPFEGMTSVSGRVEDARLTPISGASVTLTKGKSGARAENVWTDENGNYSIKVTHPLENFMLDLTVQTEMILQKYCFCHRSTYAQIRK